VDALGGSRSAGAGGDGAADVTPGAPSVSILVASRNRAGSLRALLDSLELLEPPPIPWEIVVADSASTDETPAMLAAWRAADPRRGEGRRMLRLDVPGKSRALNASFEIARGSLFAFLDDDVTPDRSWLREVVAYFADNDCAAAQGSVHWPPEAEADPEIRRRLECYRTIVRVVLPARSRPLDLVGANMAIRRSTIERVGGFDERLGAGAIGCGEDTELGHRVLRLGGWIGYMESAVVVHDVDPGRLTEEYFRDYHRRLGRSDQLYRQRSPLTWTLPKLVKSEVRFAAYRLTGDAARAYAARARCLQYAEMLRTAWQRRRATRG